MTPHNLSKPPLQAGAHGGGREDEEGAAEAVGGWWWLRRDGGRGGLPPARDRKTFPHAAVCIPNGPRSAVASRSPSSSGAAAEAAGKERGE